MADVGKVLLITGAEPASAPRPRVTLPRPGYRLVLAARSEDKLEALAGELGGDERAIAVGCDVTELEHKRRSSRPRSSASARSTSSSPTPASARTRGFLNDTPEHWREMVLTNVSARRTRSAPPCRRSRDHGHILLTGSVAGRRAIPGSLYSSRSGRSPAWASRCARTSPAAASGSR